MLPPFLPSDRPLQITTPLGPGAVLLAGVTGTEAVNELFAFDLHLLAPLLMPPFAFDKLLGQPVALRVRLPGGGHRVIHGLVTALTRGRRDRVFTHYRAELRPAWWPMTLRKTSRIFQQQTAVDILKTVLSPFGKVEFHLPGPYPRRDYTVQYQETDFHFASRIMEEEGIFYFFKHADDGHTLMLADAVAACPQVPGLLEYDPEPDAPGRAGRPLAWVFDVTQELCPTRVTVWDNHFELFRKSLAGDASAPARVRAGLVDYAPALQNGPQVPVYDHAGDYAKRYDSVPPGGGAASDGLDGLLADADRTARIRAEQAAARSVRAAGQSNAAHLTPGHVVGVLGHFEADDRYVVTSVKHTATIPETFWAVEGATDLTYTNEFEFAPTALVPRPAVRTPRPKVGGPLTAVVVGPPGQQIFVDQYGRVKVQFLWDRDGQFNSDSSCWIRVAQLWAGKTWGAFFWPRIGMEVVVHFEDGDPDRPVITGCVYNAENLPPTDLPAEATIGGIKSLIFNGDPAIHFNALFIHDTPGVEYIHMHSERGEIQNSESGRYHYVGGMEFTVKGRL